MFLQASFSPPTLVYPFEYDGERTYAQPQPKDFHEKSAGSRRTVTQRLCILSTKNGQCGS